MARRIIIFGATGFTGRLLAQRLAAQGAAPVLAGRSEASLRELAEPLGLEWQVADALRQNSVFALLEPGDVLVSTVGPFVKWGEPAVRAAIAAKGIYIDSTGEPPFIRRVFDELGPPAERAGAALLPAMGYDFVPGALAGGLALEEAGEDAVRVDVGYYAFGAGISAGTRRSAVGIMFDDGYAFRDGALRTARIAERVRSFHVRGKDRDAVSVGGSEHFALPAVASAARGGQRLPRLVRRAGPAAAGRQPGRLGGAARARRARRAEGGRRPARGASSAGPTSPARASRGWWPRPTTPPASGSPRSTCRAASRTR